MGYAPVAGLMTQQETKVATRFEKIRALTDNDLGFVAAHWGEACDPDDAISFYANGGYTTYPDEKIDELYEQLNA